MFNILIPAVTTIIDKLFPDADEAAKAKLELFKLEKQGEFQQLEADVKLAMGQVETNKLEAQSSDTYTKRWRPTIGYVLSLALAFQYLINPLILWAAVLWFPEVQPPSIGLDEHLWELMLGMLGLAGWRTVDKVKANSK